MALVEFGNASADMRQVDNFYGIPALQAFGAFAASFVPVSQETVVQTYTDVVIQLNGADSSLVTVAAHGDFTIGHVDWFSLQAAGVVETVSGNFTVDVSGNAYGTATELGIDSTLDGSLITRYSGLNVPVTASVAGEIPDLPTDEVLLAGADTIVAGAGNDYLLGYGGDDSLNGGAGADTLSGGEGDDTLSGGLGNDTYVVNSAGDVVTEAPSAGTDLVKSSVAYVLGGNVDQLLLTGTAAIDGTGNGLANSITGNAAANLLAGAGGSDSIVGGGGADTLNGGLGTDTLAGGSGSDSLLGGGARDVLVGGAYADRLSGGAGADTMVGGTGNDTFVVDNASDTVAENAGEGARDTITSSVAYVLPENVEDLTLTGTGNINATGNELANAIAGNHGANFLSGAGGDDTIIGKGAQDTFDGGAGDDTLTGGSGQDTFDFTAALDAATNVDQITGFSAAHDLIRLDNDIFTAFAIENVAIDAAAFRSGAGVSAAGDADDRILYNSATGNLFYDADGTGAEAAVRIAKMMDLPALTAADFFIIA